MNWSRGQAIGHGSSAIVSVAVSHLSGDIFAVKSAEFCQSEFLQREQKIVSSLSSPHIVSFRGCDITKENNRHMFNLMMEYVPGGSIADAIHRQRRLDESMIAYYSKQILQGLEYLHSRGIVHCDIKPGNILLAETGAKVADFGCAKMLSSSGDDDQVASKAPIGGTPMFMAPEVARGEEQGFPADIWALGCTIIEMATGGSPWSDVTTPASALYKIAFSGELPKFPDFLSNQAKDFLDKCLRRDPNQRWTAKQLLNHPFMEVELGSINSAKQTQEFNSSSPTSILDHGIWNSEEESGTSCVMMMTQTCLDSSPCQRLKRLSLNSEKAKWTWEGTWITIRSNEEREKEEEEEDEYDLPLSRCGSMADFTSYYDMEVEIRGDGGGEKSINSLVGNVGSFNLCSSNSLKSDSSSLDNRVVVHNLNFGRHRHLSIDNHF